MERLSKGGLTSVGVDVVPSRFPVGRGQKDPFEYKEGVRPDPVSQAFRSRCFG